MATDIVGGIDGSVQAAGFHGDIESWTTDIEVTEATWRTFSSRWMKRANVSYAMTGQFQGTIQFGDSDTSPAPVDAGTIDAASFEGVTLTLTATTGCTYTGTANITGVNLSRPATDRMTGTWRFAFTGEPQQTWDESGS